jgi:hypothetical protein
MIVAVAVLFGRSKMMMARFITTEMRMLQRRQSGPTRQQHSRKQ